MPASDVEAIPGGDVPSPVTGVKLDPNYPNPFIGVTKIPFELQEVRSVRLVVIDALGRIVRVLVHEIRAAGLHEVDFDAEQLPGGSYFILLETGRTTRLRMIHRID